MSYNTRKRYATRTNQDYAMIQEIVATNTKHEIQRKHPEIQAIYYKSKNPRNYETFSASNGPPDLRGQRQRTDGARMGREYVNDTWRNVRLDRK
jgi:hypothetical protein